VTPPRTAAGLAGWRALAAAPSEALLVLDFDGTLAPIVADPGAARPHPGVFAPLRRLADRLGRVAVLSGRPAALAAHLLNADTDPALSRLVVLGHYGLERWSFDGGVVGDADDASRRAVDAVRGLLPDLLARIGAPAGVTIEDKRVALAVHVRGTPDPASALALLRSPLAAVAREHGLRLEPGRLVLELRSSGVDKGAALEALARERSVSSIIYAGDDLGDLAAFDAVGRLRATGIPGLLVCSGSDEVSVLAERADLVVEGPAGIADLLVEIAEIAGG
jgi:trehalose 6-phosphate phosphatase